MLIVMEPSDLVGTWSEDVLYGPGAQSDYLLRLRLDGMGSISYETGLSSELVVFRWSFADGALSVTAVAAYLSTGAFEPQSHGGAFGVSRIAVTITVEETPQHGRTRVLRLLQPLGAGYPVAFGFWDGARPPEIVTTLLDRHASA